MANTYSSLKRIRVTERRTEINRKRKSRMRTQIKAFRALLAEKKAEAAEAALPETYSLIDKAAKQGVIKKNAAARYKSRLTKALEHLKQPAAA